MFPTKKFETIEEIDAAEKAADIDGTVAKLESMEETNDRIQGLFECDPEMADTIPVSAAPLKVEDHHDRFMEYTRQRNLMLPWQPATNILNSRIVQNTVFETYDWKTGRRENYLVGYWGMLIHYKTEEERQQKIEKLYTKFYELVNKALEKCLIGYGSLCPLSSLKLTSLDEKGKWNFIGDRYDSMLLPWRDSPTMGYAREQTGEMTHREVFVWWPVFVADRKEGDYNIKKIGNEAMGEDIFLYEGEVPLKEFV